MTDLITLTKDLIMMRKYPLKDNGTTRYPAAAVQFAEAVRTCDDPHILYQIIQLDTGHVLPTLTKQQVYEKLLANQSNRTPDLLDAFAMHLVMFGAVDENGGRLPDTDAKIDALLAESAHKRTQS